jgi:hypothetical protein
MISPIAAQAARESPEPRNVENRSTEPEEADDGVGFEDDMDSVLTKNAELYRRLAR